MKQMLNIKNLDEAPQPWPQNAVDAEIANTKWNATTSYTPNAQAMVPWVNIKQPTVPSINNSSLNGMI